MKRILIFSLAYYPRFSGAEVAIKEITDRISPQDIEFHMITLRFARSDSREVETIGHITVYKVGLGSESLLNKFLFQFLAARKALSLHKRYHYDAIWAMMAHSSGVPAAIFKLVHSHVPYILTLQEGDPPGYIEKRMLPLWPLFSRAFTSADVVQAISTFLATWARHRGFTGPLEVIPNAGNQRDLDNAIDKADIEAYKQKLGKKEGDIYLVNTSRLVHQKGIDTTIRALALLPEHISLLLVGEGSEKEKLIRLSKELGVSRRGTFIGHVDRSQTTLYRRVSDIFVCASRSEGLGHTILSAMASRLPVIATQEGGIADFLFDARRNPEKPTTGWAVDSDNPSQIAEAVKGILAHPEQTRKVVQQAHALVKEKYNWERVARDMREKVFGRVLQ